MRYNILLAACVSLGVAGCSSLPLSLQQPTQTAATQNHGSVALAIRWPNTLKTQSLPSRSQAIVLSVLKDGNPIEADRTFKRSEYAVSNNVTTLNLDLAPGTSYSLAAKVYDTEVDAEMTEEHVIATAVASAFEVRSGYQSSVKMSVTVPNGPVMDALTYPGAARGSNITMTGTNLGTDKSLIQAEFFGPYNSRTSLEVVNLVGNQLTLKVPSQINTGAGKLVITVDGAPSNENDLTMVDNLEADSPQMIHCYDNSVNKDVFYFVAHTPFTVPVKGTCWDNGTSRKVSVPVTVTVTQNGTPVSGAIDGDGKITLPSGDNYVVKVSCGDVNQEITCRVGALTFLPPASASYKVSNLGISGYENQRNVQLPGVISGAGSWGQMYLRTCDFKWEYSNPGVVQLQGENDYNSWATQQSNAYFSPAALTGATTVTARLKADPTKAFVFTMQNVGITGFTTPSSVRLSANATDSISVGVCLSDGETKAASTLGSQAYGKFLWSSDNALVSVAPKPKQYDWSSNENGVAVVTANGASGAATLTVTWSEDANIRASIPVTVTLSAISVTID